MTAGGRIQISPLILQNQATLKHNADKRIADVRFSMII
jgi:hypothetical protein